MVDRDATDRAAPSDAKVLMVGNSYTDGIHQALKQAIAHSPCPSATLTLVWTGGITLEGLIDNGWALEAIGQGGWDQVVLQDQSQRPAIPGREEELFHKAVDQLVPEIRKVGAEPLLYMTWGHREGNAAHAALSSYAAMHARLSAAYRKAATRNNIRVVPVGQAWAMVREAAPNLGAELYQPDGSHPSAKGAYLAACVFSRVLFDDPLDHAHLPDGISTEESRLMREVVRQLPLAS